MLTVLRVGFLELENYRAKQLNQSGLYRRFSKPFDYRRNVMMIMAAAITYLFVSSAQLGSMQWLLELLGIVSVATLGDVLSQWLGYHYGKVRFSKYVTLYREVVAAVKKAREEQPGSETVDVAKPTYQNLEIIDRNLQEEDHLAIMATDGGKFAIALEKLPPITYIVDINNQAKSNFTEDQVKITSMTKDGRMPFKEEKLDVVISEMANYDKYEMWRILKPGGKLIIEQLGTENYKEIMSSFIPFRIKGKWDLESAKLTLQEIGFEVLEAYEDRGYIRFNSLKALVNFTKGVVPASVENSESFMSFYAKAYELLQEHSHFDLTTYRFILVAQKPY